MRIGQRRGSAWLCWCSGIGAFGLFVTAIALTVTMPQALVVSYGWHGVLNCPFSAWTHWLGRYPSNTAVWGPVSKSAMLSCAAVATDRWYLAWGLVAVALVLSLVSFLLRPRSHALPETGASRFLRMGARFLAMVLFVTVVVLALVTPQSNSTLCPYNPWSYELYGNPFHFGFGTMGSLRSCPSACDQRWLVAWILLLGALTSFIFSLAPLRRLKVASKAKAARYA